MNCTKCGKETTDNSGFCSNCGTSLNPTNAPSDYIANAGLLTAIAAAFTLTLGVVGLLSYQTYVEYYTAYYSITPPNAYSFFMIAGFAFVAAAIGFLSMTFAFKRKRFFLTVIGPILMIASGVFVFIVETMFQLGYSDGFTTPAVPALVLSVIALAMLFKSKKAFADFDVCADDADLEPAETTESAAEQTVEA